MQVTAQPAAFLLAGVQRPGVRVREIGQRPGAVQGRAGVQGEPFEDVPVAAGRTGLAAPRRDDQGRELLAEMAYRPVGGRSGDRADHRRQRPRLPGRRGAVVQGCPVQPESVHDGAEHDVGHPGRVRLGGEPARQLGRRGGRVPAPAEHQQVRQGVGQPQHRDGGHRDRGGRPPAHRAWHREDRQVQTDEDRHRDPGRDDRAECDVDVVHSGGDQPDRQPGGGRKHGECRGQLRPRAGGADRAALDQHDQLEGADADEHAQQPPADPLAFGGGRAPPVAVDLADHQQGLRDPDPRREPGGVGDGAVGDDDRDRGHERRDHRDDEPARDDATVRVGGHEQRERGEPGGADPAVVGQEGARHRFQEQHRDGRPRQQLAARPPTCGDGEQHDQRHGHREHGHLLDEDGDAGHGAGIIRW
ncbi:hypothetical protein [Pseudonocardia sp. NPDC046786]|uniref:hypothetical protein n=1 Tax=Pseudonocardia sp. NPDC046786 TaxID=3155471 RepID=UPI0033E93EAC